LAKIETDEFECGAGTRVLGLLEPEEGKFDFSLVDELISEARRYHLKIVLLWFGTWKNSMSCYVPVWAKTDQQRFPRTENSAGKTTEIITPFSKMH